MKWPQNEAWRRARFHWRQAGGWKPLDAARIPTPIAEAGNHTERNAFRHERTRAPPGRRIADRLQFGEDVASTANARRSGAAKARICIRSRNPVEIARKYQPRAGVR